MALSHPRLEELRDPLLERDYVRLCSRQPFFRNRAMAALGFGTILLLMVWLHDEDAPLDELGRNAHAVFTWIAAVLAGSIAATEAAVAIPTERATGSLTVLLTVPRRPLRLAAGFYLSRVLVALTAILAILPLEGAALLMGGVDPGTLATAALVILATTAYAAAAGLLAGYDAADHRMAVGRTVLLLLCLTILVPAVLGLVGVSFHVWKINPDLPPPPPVDPMALDCPEGCFYALGLFLFFLSPLASLLVHTDQVCGSGLPFSTVLPVSPYAVHFAVAGVAVAGALAAILLTGMRLRADLERSAVPARRQGFRAWVARFMGDRRAGVDHGPPREAKPVWERPLLWKESRPPRGFWSLWLLRSLYLVYAGILAFLWFYPNLRKNLVEDRDTPFFYDTAATVPLWLFLLAALKSCGTFLAEERERNALDLLRVTPIPPREYFLARFIGGGMRVVPMGVVTVPFVVVGFFTGHNHPLGILAWLLGGLLVVPFLGLLVFRSGLGGPSVRAAQRRALFPIAVFLLGWPLVHLLIQWTLHFPGDEPVRVHMVFLGLNPFAAIVAPYRLVADLSWDSVADRTRNPLADQLAFAVSGCAGALLWAAAAAVLWWRLPRDFDRALHGAEES